MKQIIERIAHMFRMKDCRSTCFFCEYYDICKYDDPRYKEQEEPENEAVKRGLSAVVCGHTRQKHRYDFMRSAIRDDKKQMGHNNRLFGVVGGDITGS